MITKFLNQKYAIFSLQFNDHQESHVIAHKTKTTKRNAYILVQKLINTKFNCWYFIM